MCILSNTDEKTSGIRLGEVRHHYNSCHSSTIFTKIKKWFNDEKIKKPTLENYYEFDEENLGLPTLLKEVIFELEGVDLTACEDLNNKAFLLYESKYPWNMTPVDCFMTPERLSSLYRKYIRIISDSDYEIECHSVEGMC